MRAPTFDAPFDAWCKVVDLMLRVWTGRPLADVLVSDAALRCWWRCGVPARIVAQGLSTKMPATRATFSRFYTDDPTRVIRERSAV